MGGSVKIPQNGVRVVTLVCFTDQLEDLGVEPMLELLANMSLPRGMPTKATAEGWQLAKTLAAAQRFISKDILVEIGLEKDDTKPDNETLIMHVG